MAKIIKQKIRRSAPVLLIFTIISLSMAGFIFNFNIVVTKFSLESGIAVDVEMLSADATSDFASTTVTVKNAPPSFTTEAAEIPASTSTSPINLGYDLIFTGTAHDNESNSYYLIVCDSAGATAGAGGGVPSCTGTEFCTSALTANDAEATCTYAVQNPGAGEQVDDWYAYMCDNHAVDPDCSTVSQGDAPGTGDDSSPLYINYAPVFTAVNTTVNNQDPGGTFTFTASVTDSDTLGGVDELTLHVCTTNSWATSTGCAATELCTGTSTTPDISCDYTDTAPTPDAAYDYYGFVVD